jgi:hypothetical protein
MGYPLPVRSWRSLNARPFRSSWCCPCQGKRLLWRSSPGVRPSYTVFPEVSARSLSTDGHLSWGFLPLQRSRRRESTSRRFPSEPPGFAGVSAGRSHPTGYGAALRFSQPRSGLLPPFAVLPFSDRWRSWGSALQGFLLSRSPDDSSPPACPLDVPPIGWPSPIPRRGASGRAGREPRTNGRRLCSSSGSSSA